MQFFGFCLVAIVTLHSLFNLIEEYVYLGLTPPPFKRSWTHPDDVPITINIDTTVNLINPVTAVWCV